MLDAGSAMERPGRLGKSTRNRRRFGFILVISVCAHVGIYGAQFEHAALEKKLLSATGIGRIRILNRLAKSISDSKPQESIALSEEALKASREQHAAAEEADALHNKGVALRNLGDYDQAITLVEAATRMWQRLGEKKLEAQGLNTLGLLEFDRGELNSALQHHLTALSIRQKINDRQGIAYSFNNIGKIYNKTRNYKLAMHYLELSLAIKHQLGDMQGTAYSLTNLGIAHQGMGQDQTAIPLFRQALRIREKIGDRKGMADSYFNLGVAYDHVGDLARSLEYLREAVHMREQIQDQRGLIAALNSMGSVFRRMDLLKEAREALRRAIEIGSSVDVPEERLDTYREMSQLEAASGDYRKALELYQQYAAGRETFFDETSARRLARLQVQFETERREQEIKLLRKQEEVGRVQLARQTTFRNSLALVLVSLAITVVLVINRYRLKRRSEAHLQQKNNELEAKSRELEALNVQLSSANELKRRFLANITHEVRTPINGIVGMADLLSDTRLDADQSHCVEVIRHASASLLSIINDVLDFSRIEAGKLDLEEAPFDVRQIVDEAISVLASQAHAKGLDLAAICARETPRRVIGDALRLRQILINLIGNAVKFTARGAVLVRVEPGCMAPVTAGIRISVQDTGIGIPEDKLGLIFESFTQADLSTARRFGGTGLGLAISRELTRLMGGEISVISRPESGSTFTIDLPLPVADSEPEPEFPQKFSGRRVLILGHGAVTTRVVAEACQSVGMTVEFVSSAEALKERLENQSGSQISLVILDGRSTEVPAILCCWDDISARPSAILLYCPGQPPVASAIRSDIRSLAMPVQRSLLLEMLDQVFGSPRQDSTRNLKGFSGLGEDGAGPGTTPLRVLVVEDNPINRRIASASLAKLGCAVECAISGTDALARWQQQHFDLILMDCEMPDVDGLETTRRIRVMEPPGCRVPIIAITASATEEARLRCLEAGMDDYLSKPFSAESLRRVIESATSAGSLAEPL